MSTNEYDLRAKILMLRALAEALPAGERVAAALHAMGDCVDLARVLRAGRLDAEAGRLERAMARLVGEVVGMR